MPNKKDHDAAYWKERRARLLVPDPTPSSGPAILPCEDPAEFAALVAAHYASFKPTCPEERAYVDEVIHCEWTLRRLQRTETELNLYVHENCSNTHPDYPLGQAAADSPRSFSALQWRINSTLKALKDAIAAFRDLRAHPIPDSPSADEHEPEPVTPCEDTPPPEIGFVFESPAERSAETTCEPLPPAPSHAT